jgi:hypothetical protein
MANALKCATSETECFSYEIHHYETKSTVKPLIYTFLGIDKEVVTYRKLTTQLG